MHRLTERALYFRVFGFHVDSNFQYLLAEENCSLWLVTNLHCMCCQVSLLNIAPRVGFGPSVQRRHSSAITWVAGLSKEPSFCACIFCVIKTFQTFNGYNWSNQMVQVQNSDSETPLKKQNPTPRIDLRLNSLCTIFLMHPVDTILKVSSKEKGSWQPLSDSSGSERKVQRIRKWQGLLGLVGSLATSYTYNTLPTGYILPSIP